jgi:uncharacterized protein with HEPN domain
MQLEARKCLYDIQEAANLASQFTSGKAFEDYQRNPMLRFAIERAFAIIGEALVQLAKVTSNSRIESPSSAASLHSGTS